MYYAPSQYESQPNPSINSQRTLNKSKIFGNQQLPSQPIKTSLSGNPSQPANPINYQEPQSDLMQYLSQNGQTQQYNSQPAPSQIIYTTPIVPQIQISQQQSFQPNSNFLIPQQQASQQNASYQNESYQQASYKQGSQQQISQQQVIQQQYSIRQVSQQQVSVNRASVQPALGLTHSRIIIDQEYNNYNEGRPSADNKINELVKHMNPGNIESLMTLFRLQKPLTLTLPNQGASVFKVKSTLNQQVPTYQSTYYQQLDAEAERVRERVKEESKVVSFIIERYKRTHEIHLRMKKEGEELTQQLIVYHKQHKIKVFKKETKYTFQLLESKTDELKDFYEEVYNLMELFSVAAHEHQKPQGVQQLQYSKLGSDQQVVQKLYGTNQQASNLNSNILAGNMAQTQLRDSQISKIGVVEGNSDSKGIDMQSHAVKLFADLQHYAKHIETTLSEQRRVQNVSQENLQFKQLSQSLLQELQNYPVQENKSFEELVTLYVMNSQYYKMIALDARDFLQIQNDLVGQLRDGISSIDRLIYLNSVFAEVPPQINVYYEVLDRLLEGKDLTLIDPNTIPHPDTLNQPIIQKLTQLHNQFKQSNYDSSRHPHFKNVRSKVYKKCQVAIQSQKQLTRDVHSRQVELLEFIQDTIRAELNANQLISQTKITLESMQIKLTRKGINDIKSQFTFLDSFQSDLQIRQRKAISMKEKIQDIHYVAIINRIEATLEPINQQLLQCSIAVDSYVSLGDADAIIEFQDLTEQMQKEERRLNDYIETFVQKISVKIRESTDVESFEKEKLNLQKKFLPIRIKMQEMKDLLQRVVNDAIKTKINIILGKWVQLSEVASGIEGLLDAVEFFSKDNIQTIGEDFQDLDNHTTIAQLEEVCLEHQQKVQAISERAKTLSWTLYRAHDYETLIHSELEGYQWMQKLLTRLLQFQKGIQTLIVKDESQRRIQDQQGIKNLNQSDQLSIQESANKQIIQFSDFLVYIQKIPFSDLMLLRSQSHPQTQRWTSYQKLIDVQLITISQIYFKKTFRKIDTLGGGISLNSGIFDNHKAEVTVNWIRRVKSAQMLESAIEIIQGLPLSDPKIMTELLEFCIIAYQVYDRVKKQIELRIPKIAKSQSQSQVQSEIISVSDQQFESNLREIEHQMSNFFEGLDHFFQNVRQGPEQLGIRLCEVSQPDANQVDKLAPLILLCMSFQNSNENYQLLQVVTYVNFQSAWINYTLQYFDKYVSIFDDTLYEQVVMINQILLYSPLRLVTIKEIYEIYQVPQIMSQYITNCQTQVELMIMKDNMKQEFLDLKMHIKAIQTYKKFSEIASILVANIQQIEEQYIQPLESQQKRVQRKLSYLPQTFIEEIYERIMLILATCDTISNFQNVHADVVQLGIIKIDLKQLILERTVIYRWGFICQTIVSALDSNQQFFHDYSQLNDPQYPGTQIQNTLMQTWRFLEK